MQIKNSTNFCWHLVRKLRLPGLFLIGIFLAGMQTPAFSQDRTISGTVRSEQGDALPGVNVIIKGTARGTTADSDGKYSLLATNGEILVFSFIGYAQQEISVGNQTILNISLAEDLQSLSEVVITAFGLEKEKKAITYSAQEVKGSDLTIARETNVLNSLKGRVAGVHINSSSAGPTGSSYIAIRGNSSLAGNNQPLFVVDGVPINNDYSASLAGRDYGDGIKDINPDDIESITVLKGPNGSALYGSRGANGVILITSKKGSKGLGVSINSNATFETPNTVPTFQNKFAPGYDNDLSSWNTVTIDGVQYKQHPGWLIDNWGGPLDGQLVAIETMPELGLVPLTAQPSDNVRNFYRTGKTFTNTVSLSGGTDKSNFRLSLSDLTNTSIVPKSSFDRKTINLVAGSHISDKLYVEAKANYIKESGENRSITGPTLKGLPNSLGMTPRYIDFDWLKDYKGPDGKMKTYKNDAPYNPYWLINEFKTNDQRDRLIGYVYLTYKLTNWLNIKGRTGTDMYTDVRNERIGQGNPGLLGGSITNGQYRASENNTDVFLTASGNLSSNITGTISAGGSIYKRRYESAGSYGESLVIPGLYHISNTTPTTRQGIYYLERKEIQSLYMSGQLTYKNHLFLDLTARNDWSSTLGQNNYSFFYPSVGLSYAITDAFDLSSNILSFAKLRASYAQAGTDAAPYRTKGGYSISTTGFNGQVFSNINSNVPLLDLKNELKTSWELGTDIRLFKNRVSVDFTYYNAATTNQIVQIQLPSGTGYSSKQINSGEVQNKGIEVFVSGQPVVIGNSFLWDIGINYSKNRSEIISLYPGISTLVLQGGLDATIEARPGEPYGNIVGFQYMRNDEGRKILTPTGNVQRGANLVVLGNIQPKWLAGVTNTFSFKGITLSALVDIRNGGEVYSFTKADGTGKGLAKYTENVENTVNDGLIDNGDETFTENTIDVGRQNFYASRAWGNIGEEFVLDASYVSLREASLSYDLHPSLLSKTPFRTVRISVVGRNLAYLYRDPEFKTMGISPEAAFAPTAPAQGYEVQGLPSTRSIGFNLSLSF